MEKLLIEKGSIIHFLEEIERREYLSFNIGMAKGSRFLCNKVNSINIELRGWGREDESVFQNWHYTRERLEQGIKENKIKVYSPPFKYGNFPDELQAGDTFIWPEAKGFTFRLEKGGPIAKGVEIPCTVTKTNINGFLDAGTYVANSKKEFIKEIKEGLMVLIDGPTFNERSGITISRVIPRNNDGRTSCFWCNGKTRLLDTGFASNMCVCTECGK